MNLRLGILSAAHVHTASYVHCCKAIEGAECLGVWDDNPERGSSFAAAHAIPFFGDMNHLLDACDAVVITAENVHHVELATCAAERGKHILCEKPLATTVRDAHQMVEAAKAGGVTLMTAFPCPFSPAFAKALDVVQRGVHGPLKAISATNRGTCPGGWFVDPALSGGGALMDHVVHVADLMRRLLGKNATRVHAQTGNQIHQMVCEDTAMLTLDYGSGVFASLDSSWSRLPTYRTWGDVTLNLVFEAAVIELDLFHQEVHHYGAGLVPHKTHGFGSNLDMLMVQEFVSAIREGRPPSVTGEDGLEAVRVVEAGYRSVQSGQPESLVA